VRKSRRGYVARRSNVSEHRSDQIDGTPVIEARTLPAIRVALMVRGMTTRLTSDESDGVVEFWM
jgi:hypothetical protein